MKVTLEKWDKWTIDTVWGSVLAIVAVGVPWIAVELIDDGPPTWIRVVCPLVMVLAAYLPSWYAKKHEKEYLKAVRDEMSFQELKERVEAEEFELLFDADADSNSGESPFRALVSKDWLLLEVPGVGKPVCIPKRRVREVDAFGYVKEDGDGDSGRCFLKFLLDDGKSFESGGERIRRETDVASALRTHFPNAKVDVSIGDFGKA